jgi:3-phenylpropionate/trans-cinnamate dioxygenase ferredoxin reductase subunit
MPTTKEGPVNAEAVDPRRARIVVVGAGQAGAALVARLRALGHAGPLTLVGEEPVPPYQRPPLSKAYLKGEATRERLFLRPPSFYDGAGIALLTGVRATAIDRAGRAVVLADGRRLPYDRLALTTGARPRRLPAACGGDLPGVHVMRALADADALAAVVQPGARALIVGGGYIGLEAAAVLAEKGLAVTLVEAAPRILARVAAPATADYFRALHRSHGVTVREADGLERLTGDARVTGAVLADGTALAADLVLVGIGVEPDTRLAAEAGLAIDNGIAVDELGHTSDPAIFAAGDATSFPHGGLRVRLESVPNAIDQAEAVAAAMLGGTEPYVARPWFWSDQYDVKLQIAGLNAGWERTIIRHGPRPGSQSVWYWQGDRLLSVDAMNDPRAYMTAKRWIEAGLSPDPAAISDPATDLKAIA